MVAAEPSLNAAANCKEAAQGSLVVRVMVRQGILNRRIFARASGAVSGAVVPGEPQHFDRRSEMNKAIRNQGAALYCFLTPS